MEVPGMFRRITAFIIDSIIVSLCFLPVWLQILGSRLSTGTMAVSLQWVLIGCLLQLFYNWLFLYFLGGTLGKLMLGLRVVPYAHPEQPLGLMQSLLRVLTDALSIFFGLALRAFAFIRLDRTHVSDWVAETRVVQKASRQTRPRRHWVIAILIMIFSFSAQFQRIYQLVQSSEISAGELVIDAGY